MMASDTLKAMNCYRSSARSAGARCRSSPSSPTRTPSAGSSSTSGSTSHSRLPPRPRPRPAPLPRPRSPARSPGTTSRATPTSSIEADPARQVREPRARRRSGGAITARNRNRSGPRGRSSQADEGDRRRRERNVVGSWYHAAWARMEIPISCQNPGGSFLVVSNTEADAHAAYRFVENEKITLEEIQKEQGLLVHTGLAVSTAGVRESTGLGARS